MTVIIHHLLLWTFHSEPDIARSNFWSIGHFAVNPRLLSEGGAGMWTIHLGFPPLGIFRNSRIECERRKQLFLLLPDSSSSSLYPISCAANGCIRCILAIQLFNQVDAFGETCWQSSYNYMLKACLIKYAVQ